MADLLESIAYLRTLIDAAETDVIKVMRGNKAAGTRVRRHMQELKIAAQDIRIMVQKIRYTG